MGVRDTRLGVLRSGYLQSMDTASIGDVIQAYESISVPKTVYMLINPSRCCAIAEEPKVRAEALEKANVLSLQGPRSGIQYDSSLMPR